MATATAGTWTVDSKLSGDDRDERQIFADGEGGPVIGAIWPMGDDFDDLQRDGERDANARLIVAAVNAVRRIVAVVQATEDVTIADSDAATARDVDAFDAIVDILKDATLY